MTAALIPSLPSRLLSFLLLAALPLGAAPPRRDAPNLSAKPVDQLVVSGNACGPAALLNAFRFGNGNWQGVETAVTGETDKAKITMIIRQRGLRPSNHLKGKPRWGRHGVNVADLCDIANEMTAGRYLPRVSQEVFFLNGTETPEQLLRRVHSRMESSLKKGLPPVVSIRRYVHRGQNGNPPAWMTLDGHFVTIVSLPRKLPRGGTSFPVTYIDPWGARTAEGEIRIPPRPVLTEAGNSPCLEAVFPGVHVGRKGLRAGEENVVVIAAAIGRW